LPSIVVLLVPIIVMATLVFFVKRHPAQVRILDARTVATQSLWYLGVIFQHVLVTGLDWGARFYLGKQFYGFQLFSLCDRKLLGFYITMVYLKLRVRPYDRGGDPSHNGTGRKDRRSTTTTTLNEHHSADDNGRLPPLREEGNQEEEIVFTIFDGTRHGDSPWSDYLFDGDSVDEEADQEESIKWEKIVQS